MGVSGSGKTFLGKQLAQVISKPFYDADADAALFDAIKGNLNPDVPVVEMDCEINDVEFAKACAEALLGHLGN